VQRTGCIPSSKVNQSTFAIAHCPFFLQVLDGSSVVFF